MSTDTQSNSNRISPPTHRPRCAPTDCSLSSYLRKLNQMIFLTSNKAVFILLGPLVHPQPPSLPPARPAPPPALRPHRSGISFPRRIPLKCCHVGWRQSAELLLRYSCSFSKAPKFNLWTHLLPCLSVTKKGVFIIRSTHLIWSQQARLAWPICALLHGRSQPSRRGKGKHEQTKV